MPFERVCSLDEIPEGKPLKVSPAGQLLMVSKVEGAVHACSRVCLHRGADLSGGELQGSIVTCPLHFWQFDVKSGACVQVPQMALKTQAVKIENQEVHVEI